MGIFVYKIKNKDGVVVKGKLEAESEAKVLEYLHAQGGIVISVKLERGKGSQAGKRGKIKADELVIFSRQLTTLIRSGITLVESLDILQQQTTNLYFKNILTTMRKNLQEGASFSLTVAQYPRVFSELYVSMVEAAETSGNLSEILERLSGYLEKAHALRKKIISSLTYPAVVVFMAVVITSFLVFKVIPTFKGIFAMLKGELPLPTKMLIAATDFIKQYIVYVIFASIGAIIGFKKYVSTPLGKKQYHRVLLKMPIVGDIIKKIAIAQFARTFSTLTRSGVPILTSLDIVGKTSGNRIIEEAVLKAKKAIQEGLPISQPLEESGIFPPLVVKMIGVGERTGRLEEMLTKIAEFYEEQTEMVIANLTSLIEPLVIGFLGIVIGGIVVALFLPIIQITQLIGR